jgi:hypothetical protein
MRTATVLIMGFLIVGLLALTFWPIGVKPFDPSPPGQYPLGSSRYEWSATQKTKAYQPSAAMGSDTVSLGSGLGAPKAICALNPTCTEAPITL